LRSNVNGIYREEAKKSGKKDWETMREGYVLFETGEEFNLFSCFVNDCVDYYKFSKIEYIPNVASVL
jgi:hypothetical protein